MPEVEAYLTRDIVADFVAKMDDGKRQAPAKPLPYKKKDVVADETNVRGPPSKPAPFRPKTIQDSFPSEIVTSGEERLQSPATPFSPKFPVIVPGSPTLSSAKLLNSPPSSNSSSPQLSRSSQFKPPPPPRVSSIADAVKDDVIKASTSAVEASLQNSGLEVNGGPDRFDKNEIPTRDTNGPLPSKPTLPPKPLVGPKPFQERVDIGPPNFKPPPPSLSSSLFTRLNGVTSGSVTSDREISGAQNGTDSFVVTPPPPVEYLDGRSERSASKTSLDSLDLKIVPPPPMHFKEFDDNNDTGTVDFSLQTLIPPLSWEEAADNNNINILSYSRKSDTGLKRGSQKSNDLADFDLAIVPPPPPSLPPPTLPLSSQDDYDLDLIPSTLSYGSGELNIDDILGDFDQHLSVQLDDEDSLPPAPRSPAERYMGVPPPPEDGLIKPLVPPLRKQR